MSKDNNDNWRNQSNINNPSQLPVNKPAIPERPVIKGVRNILIIDASQVLYLLNAFSFEHVRH